MCSKSLFIFVFFVVESLQLLSSYELSVFVQLWNLCFKDFLVSLSSVIDILAQRCEKVLSLENELITLRCFWELRPDAELPLRLGLVSDMQGLLDEAGSLDI